MAADTRRQGLLLMALLAVLAVVGWWQFGGSAPAVAPGAARGARATSPTGRVSGRAAPEAPSQVLAQGVRLGRLDEDRPAPEAGARDPFRGGAAPAPDGDPAVPSRPTPLPPPAPSPIEPVDPAQPPPPPSIAVKFIGVVSRRDVGKVAVLSDGKNVYYGRAGDIVDGRWRIVSIGEESLQIEYADGRGRLTVRLTG